MYLYYFHLAKFESEIIFLEKYLQLVFKQKKIEIFFTDL